MNIDAITYDDVAAARDPGRDLWDFGNHVLYDLCRRYPEHRDIQVVTAKVWLIGRA